MKKQLDHKKEEQNSAIFSLKRKTDTGSSSLLTDNRPSTVVQRKLRDTMIASPEGKVIANRIESSTGLPLNLKTGMEKLSGYSLDDVRVHYNSNKPAQLRAHAFAQGNDIHLGPGQEKHLSHELGHVVQQKRNEVTPTFQLKGKVNINDDPKLEKEADLLGRKAEQMNSAANVDYHKSSSNGILQSGVTSTSALDKTVQRAEDGTKDNDPTFEQIINDPYAVLYFRAFLSSELSNENIDFINAAREWLPTRYGKPSYFVFGENSSFKRIYDKFIFDDNAVDAVNISYKYRDKLEKVLTSNMEKDLQEYRIILAFDKIYEEIFELSKRDSFGRFKKTKLFEQAKKFIGFKGNVRKLFTQKLSFKKEAYLAVKNSGMASHILEAKRKAGEISESDIIDIQNRLL